MSEFVVDASAALAWLTPTQATGPSVSFLLARDQERFVAPHIFQWEVSNVLLSLHRRGILSITAVDRAFADLAAFEIMLRPALSEVEVGHLSVFARQTGLSLFDASYLALAIERSCAVVTRDAQLLAAARLEQVVCTDLSEQAPS